ncbi:MAG: Fic family protein [Firmicutes bacterium]|nr:Fic family protein [Bacillota bacterium]
MTYTDLIRKRDFCRAYRRLLPPGEIGGYEYAFRTDYTHNSTAIEGNTLTEAETKLLLEEQLSVGGRRMREIFEVTNHAKAYDYARQCVEDSKPLCEDIVRELHRILMENILPGGEYRSVSLRVANAGLQPPPPKEMRIQIAEFFEHLSHKMAPSIELAAWALAEFARVHPFLDGNGRVSRLIMNYQLMSDGWFPVSIALEDRERYSGALRVYALDADIKPFAAFVAELEQKELDWMIEAIMRETWYKGDDSACRLA